MNLKRFCAPSVDEALARIRRELGEEAVILSTSEITPPGGARQVEILAAADLSSRPVRAARGKGRGDPIPEPSAAAHGLLDHLLQNDVDPRLAEALIRRVEGSTSKTRDLEDLLEKAIPVDGDGLAPVTAFIGATGVGKSTTLAKLAAREARERPVAVVTCDTCRIAAVEQMAILADLMDVPFAAAYTPLELDEAVRDFTAGGARVLIDTPGLSPRDGEGIRSLGDFLPPPDRCLRYLVAPATIRSSDVGPLLDGFNRIGVDRLILSKLDETSAHGPILTLLARARRPVSWVTFGQAIPGDIAPADSRELARLMLMGDAHVRFVEKTA
jgi:flagellar biosynthesis protein FlhF